MMKTLGVSQPEVCFLNLTEPFFTFHFFFTLLMKKVFFCFNLMKLFILRKMMILSSIKLQDVDKHGIYPVKIFTYDTEILEYLDLKP